MYMGCSGLNEWWCVNMILLRLLYFRVIAIFFIRKLSQPKLIWCKHKPIIKKKNHLLAAISYFLISFFVIEFTLKYRTLFKPFKVLKCKIILIIMDITYIDDESSVLKICCNFKVIYCVPLWYLHIYKFKQNI